MPFLGMHFTHSPTGSVDIGPTAMPALGSEHYGGLRGIDWWDLPYKLAIIGRKYTTNQHGFRDLAHREFGTLTNSGFFASACKLVNGLKQEHLMPSSKTGIRPQLMRWGSLELIMDFKIEPGPDSTHILNTVSPAFTCSFSFADFILQEYLCK
jgi:hypothetical protein